MKIKILFLILFAVSLFNIAKADTPYNTKDDMSAINGVV